MKRRRAVSATLVVPRAFQAAVALAMAACTPAHADVDTPPAPSRPVRLAPVLRGSLARPVRAAGWLSHRHASRLAFDNGGRLVLVAAEAGDHVRGGQLVARVDDTEIGAEASRAQAALDKAERDLLRVERLADASTVPTSQVEDARTATDLLREAARATQHRRAATELRAPADGTIDRRWVERDEIVPPGAPVFDFSPDGPLVLRVGLGDPDAARVRVGNRATVTAYADSAASYPATVSIVETTTDGPGLGFRAELTLEAQGSAWIAGMIATAEIAPEPDAPTTIIPVSALVDVVDHKAAVYTVAGGKAERVAVGVAWVVDDRVSVTGGLEGIAFVVSEGAQYLQPGSRVREMH